MKRRAFIVVLLLMCASMMRAQYNTVYTCDFETSSENAQWVLNATAKSNTDQWLNKWYIGAAGGFGVGTSSSSKGLYISSGTGADTLISSYTSSQSVIATASRTLSLAAGTYSVVFDWVAKGSNEADGIYVFWMESDAQYPSYGTWSTASSLSLPPYVTNATRYGGTDIWRSSAFTFSTAGNGGKLVVMWLNTLTAAAEPAGKVDNISIYAGTTCPPPTGVRYHGDTQTITWNGNASSYDVMLYNFHTQTLSTYPGLTTRSMQMPDVSEEGYYYIYVRSVCDEGYSTWVYTEQFIWLKGARCIDLFDLGADRSYAGVCYVGEFDDFIRYNRQGTLGRVDNGPRDPSSMHTIHIDRNEIDPNTTVNGGLHTVPPGEIASVRLGAYTSAGQSARVEYKYTVLPGMSDLLDLKYAVVMESGNHGSSLDDPDMNPTFTLNILDGNGQELDACSQRYFVAGFGDQRNWHQEPENADIYWCDWSTVTVSLRRYVGQTITLRLTSARCSYNTHPAYAYFTLNCRGGDLQGVACGDFSTDHFEAPAGFNYKWYRDDDPTKQTLSTSQRFDIDPDDPTVYVVDVIDKNAAGCSYSLTANPNPRFPQARASVISTQSGSCTNKVTFAPNCHVVRINRQTLDSVLTDEPVESIWWDFGDGSAQEMSMDGQVSHDYPAEGGEFDVTISAVISGGVCTDSHTFRISLPDLTTPDVHEQIHYCEEGTDWTETTDLINQYGCNYQKVVHHMYHPTYETTYQERMCEGGRYYFPGDGKYYTTSVDTSLQLHSQYGCDSVINLHLVVDPRLDVEYPYELKVCSEDAAIEIPYRVVSGSMDSIKVYFSEADQQRGFEACYGFANGEDVIIPLPEGVYPDLYDVHIEFGGERCQMDMQSMQLMLTYPVDIFMQTGGFLAVQNAAYNGGYEFVSFAWFRNGEKMDENASYIPTNPTDIGATYVLSLVREGEKYSIESCPLVYDPHAQGIDDVSAENVVVWPTMVQAGGTLWMAPGEACTIYNILGAVVARYPKSETTRSITAPAQAGMYLVVSDNHQSTSIIVR